LSGIEINKKIVLINSASSAVSLLLNLSVLIWLQQYLLKRISPEEYSLIPLLGALMVFPPILTSIFTSALGRYTTIAYAKNNTKEVTRITSTMFPILLVVSIVLLTIGWLGAWNINKIINIPYEFLREAQIMFALLILLAAVQLQLVVFSSGLIIKQKLLLNDLIDTGCQFFRIALLFILLFKVDVRVLWVTVSWVLSEILRISIVSLYSKHLIPSQRVRLRTFSWSLAREILGFGGWGFISHLGEVLKKTMDPILLNRFSSAVQVSVFNVAGIVPRQLVQFLTPLTRTINTSFYSNCSSNICER